MIYSHASIVKFFAIQVPALFVTGLSIIGYVTPIVGLIAAVFAVLYGYWHYRLAKMKAEDYIKSRDRLSKYRTTRHEEKS